MLFRSPPAASSSSGHSGRSAGSGASPSSSRREDCGVCDGASHASPNNLNIERRNVEANPNSAEAYDSLADAYLKDRQFLAAKSAEDHSVQLARQWANPNLIRFEQKAKKLEQQFQEQEMEKKKSGKNP